MVVAIGDSDEEEEPDANLEELLELQSLGIKVVLPTRKRKETAATELQEGGAVKASRRKSNTGGASGSSAAQGGKLSAAEGK